ASAFGGYLALGSTTLACACAKLQETGSLRHHINAFSRYVERGCSGQKCISEGILHGPAKRENYRGMSGNRRREPRARGRAGPQPVCAGKINHVTFWRNTRAQINRLICI